MNINLVDIPELIKDTNEVVVNFVEYCFFKNMFKVIFNSSCIECTVNKEEHMSFEISAGNLIYTLELLATNSYIEVYSELYEEHYLIKLYVSDNIFNFIKSQLDTGCDELTFPDLSNIKIYREGQFLEVKSS